MSYKSLMLLSVLGVFIFSCATLSQRESKEHMAMALQKIEVGKKFNAIQSALKALYLDPHNKNAKKFLIENAKTGVSEAVESIGTISVSKGNLHTVKERANVISLVQQHLKTKNIIKQNIVDTNEIINKYKEKLSIKMLSDIKSHINRRDSKIATSMIEEYKNNDLLRNDDFVQLVNELQLSYIAKNDFRNLIEFTKNNKRFMKDNTEQVLCKYLHEVAAECESKNQQRTALEIYSFLAEMEAPAVDKFISEKINNLRNDLVLMLGILELENESGEFIPVSYEDFAQMIKQGLNDEEKLIEVVLEDNGLDELRERDIYFNSFRKLKSLDITDVRFDHNIRYLIVPRIRTLKIFRQPPMKRTKTIDWDYGGGTDGNPFQIAAKQMKGYGYYKVQYFEYDESTERVDVKMVFDLLVYDIHKRRILLKDRFEILNQDAAIWVENPMAIGLLNKIPATTMPSRLEFLMARRDSTKSDNELKEECLRECTSKIISKVKQLLYQKP